MVRSFAKRYFGENGPGNHDQIDPKRLGAVLARVESQINSADGQNGSRAPGQACRNPDAKRTRIMAHHLSSQSMQNSGIVEGESRRSRMSSE